MANFKNKDWKNGYVDLHCHAALKPFGKSFNYEPVGINHPHRSRLNSIWKHDPPSIGDKILNYLTGLTKFRQSDFTSLARGGVRVICASLYPIEKWFFVNRIKNEFIRDITANFATGIGKNRVDAVQAMTNYFKDLEQEYDFYRQLDGKVIRLPEGKFTYRIVNSYAEIKALQKQPSKNINTICVVLSIEGMHVLNPDIDKKPGEASFLNNLQKLKNWEHPPFFVTVAHHFWNHLCGHSESFSGLVKKKVDQTEGLNTGFTPLGKKIITRLLDRTDGKRILIDVKHMSPVSRNEFYQMLENNPGFKDVPVIVSHGAANGLRSFGDKTAEGSEVAGKLNPVDINIFNDELIRIAKSEGILGLQLDERRIAGKETLEEVKHSVWRSKIMHYRSELLWYQVQHILEVLDHAGLFAWDCMALGTDYDGIIDPLNSFWTSEELPYLADFLERHAYNYMESDAPELRVKENRIEADEIVARIFSENALRFLERHFK
ncbi:membrane dipeptidase [Sinomicrobium weinanense]|uniref:Membrane dipeptidase n=1 Tax=Sinomicrobium weinanense TaxID=2842200 RepID=A0A926JVE6_9FLAO|nr:membrane dipeptidase [Sinomicrobium weinanense]MBC9798079.1 membrane dipeptidase [Sinomicrobium weinanense]MBU3122559.1 membrane dipeptidase [Sinomicrobium weinanense]